MKTNFLFGIFPYIALGLLAGGTVVRFLLLRKQPEVFSSELAQAQAVFGGNRLWRISLVFLLIGHGMVLAMPRMVLVWNSSSTRLYLLEGAAFTVGCAALAAWFALLWRSLKKHCGSALNELADVMLLALVFAGIFSGLLVAMLYRWGSTWGAMTLSPYFVSVLQGEPTARFVAQMPFLVRLHVFSLFACFAILPATRIGTVLVVALHGVLGVAGRVGSAGARAAEGWFKKHNPAPWLWPEED